MNWFFSIIRIAGVAFPVASSLVQLQTEIDSAALSNRIKRLEDPISTLHDDVQPVGRLLYSAITKQNSSSLEFEGEFYTRFTRVLAILESQHYIKGYHVVGKRYAHGLEIYDPTFIMYLCELEEDSNKMTLLFTTVDECKIGTSLNGNQVAVDLGLPEPVVKAVFTIYASKGLGLLSKEIGSNLYTGRA